MMCAVLAVAIVAAVPAVVSAAEPIGTSDEPVESDNDSDGYVQNESPAPLVFSGYVDVGFAKAQGNGSSFRPDYVPFPPDYAVDAFAPAVNSRGDVASTSTGDIATNGFLPRSLGIGNRPSAFISTVSSDLRYQAPGAPVMVFTRLQLLPRFGETGDNTRLVVDQAFGRITPLDAHEFTIAAGKFDSVVGIEYLEREANLRTGITPSLIARYTTGTSVGAKVFYRKQLAPLWSALSLNVAGTNSAPFTDALQTSSISLTGRPVFTGRVGYELNLPGLQVKLGASGVVGPRNDQGDPHAMEKGRGADVRVYALGVTLAAQAFALTQDPGSAADKRTGQGLGSVVSGFEVRGGYATLAYDLPWSCGALRKATLYGRFEQRYHAFEGNTSITVRRMTLGARVDLWDVLAVKAEALLNREIEGTPSVDNDVYTSSAVWMW